MTFQAPKTIPGLDPEPDRAIGKAFAAIQQELARALVEKLVMAELKTSNYSAKLNEIVPVTPPATGVLLLVPEGTAANQGAVVLVAVTSVASGGSVTVAVAGGQQRVNGASTLGLSSVGLTYLLSLGLRGWLAISGGGAASLAAVLAVGNTTSGTDVVISTGDELIFGNGAPVRPGNIRSALAQLLIAGDNNVAIDAGADIMISAVGGFAQQAVTGNIVLQALIGSFFMSGATLDMTGYIVLHNLASGGAPLLTATQASLFARAAVTTNVPCWKDDQNALWNLAYTALDSSTAAATATNATTNLACGSFTVPAGTSRANTTYSFEAYAVFVATLVGAPTLTLEILVNSVVVSTAILTVQALAATWGMTLTGRLTFYTVGGAGTAVANCRFSTEAVNGGTICSSVNTATFAVDTTVNRLIEMRVRMTTAVAANTLTVTQRLLHRPR